MNQYDPKSLEPKWQKTWAETNLYAAIDGDPRPKYYMLTEFPYPSGAGLHAGHSREYTLGDVIARHKRMQGHNVLFPMGWDAFGLPAENFAIKNKIHPSTATTKNVANFKRQMTALGLGFDWSREVNTTDPDYYRWTQWLFLQFFRAGLAYQDEIAINWCPFEKTGLANEEVVNGVHERCGTPVEKKLLKQWMLAITKYADRLIQGLGTVDYPSRIADQQINWIGRSEGAEIDFALGGSAMKRVILMHGKNVTARDKWYPWLGQQVEAAGLKYEAPELTTDDRPNLAEWTSQLNSTKPDEATVLIGHSRGGVAILRWLEQAPAKLKVGRVVLVATNRGDKPDAAAGDFFYTDDYDFTKIKSHCNEFVVIHSRDDKWVPFEQGEHIAQGLGVEILALDGKNHFGDNTPQVPEILQRVLGSTVVTVYTTRPDTLGGATFLVLAPEHSAVARITTPAQRAEVEAYIKAAQAESELARQEENRPKTGVFTGAYATNPITHERMPVWIADYVLAGYGTGAIMAVPAHDERDFAFARAMNLQMGATTPRVFVDQTETPPRPDLPFEYRKAALVIVEHPTEKKYLVQRLKAWETQVYSFPMGGIEFDENPVTAARRELAEETGYDHIASINEFGIPYIAEFYHEHKQVNRRAHVHPVVVKLADLHRQTVSAEEQALNELHWLTGPEVEAKHHGKGAQWTFGNYFAGRTLESLKIIPVIDPIMVRDDAKDHTEFEKRRSIVAVVENAKHEILTINWGPKLGGRLTIGGTIEGSDTPEATALREVAEETGYHDLEVVEIGQETIHYKYYAFSKQKAHDTKVTPVHLRLRSEARRDQHLDESEKGNFTVEWVSRDQAERQIVEPLHRYGLNKFIFGHPYTGTGLVTNSAQFNSLPSAEAKIAVTDWLAEQGIGRRATKYRLRDWIFSRQHYWGEPIPIIHCPHCAAKAAKSKLSLSFYDQFTWDAILSGVKSIESRALNPNEPTRFYGEVKIGDTIGLVNKKTGETAAAEVLEARTYDSVKSFHADTDWATACSSTGQLKPLAQWEHEYAAYTPDYTDRIKQHGLVAWKIHLLTQAVPVCDDQLPVKLPDVEHYEPTDSGESPLAAITDWVNTTCPTCGKPAKRETDTMPNWAGSSWYWLRYMDPHNGQAFADPAKLKYWGEVDLYLGGMEHTTLHLLYSRFWHQFLYDQKLVPTPEPYAARRGQGIVLAADGRKMSKSLGNVIDPTDVIARYGADAFRLYIMFMAPYDETTPWSDERLGGVSRFLFRVWTLAQDLMQPNEILPGSDGYEQNPGAFITEVDRATHKTIKKVHDDLGAMRFNTVVSTLMEYLNFLVTPANRQRLLQDNTHDLRDRTLRALILTLAPGAPHIAEELWHELGEQGSVHVAAWPKYDPALLHDDIVTIVVQVNGRVRGQVVAAVDIEEAELINLASIDPKVAPHLEGKHILKTIVVPRRLVNFVVKEG